MPKGFESGRNPEAESKRAHLYLVEGSASMFIVAAVVVKDLGEDEELRGASAQVLEAARKRWLGYAAPGLSCFLRTRWAALARCIFGERIRKTDSRSPNGLTLDDGFSGRPLRLEEISVS